MQELTKKKKKQSTKTDQTKAKLHVSNHAVQENRRKETQNKGKCHINKSLSSEQEQVSSFRTVPKTKRQTVKECHLNPSIVKNLRLRNSRIYTRT